jgi:antitoxin VapB
VARSGRLQKESGSFLKKRTKKLLVLRAVAAPSPPKEVLACFCCLSPPHGLCFWHRPKEGVMRAGQRPVKLFRNGRNQAVRIPVEFELPGTDAIMFREGDRIVIEPARKPGLAALLESWADMSEEFPEIEDPAPEAEEIF